VPATEQIATSPDYTEAIKSQTHRGWGQFFKGFSTTGLQKWTTHTQHNRPLNTFKQLTWTSEVIQCVWDSESEHWKQQNGDKHGLTTAETDARKREQLLAAARELVETQHKLPPRYRTIFPAYSKLTKKRTKNLETWVNTTHYLLKVKNKQMMTLTTIYSQIQPTNPVPHNQ
jgi:hypothetical protein